MTATTPTATMTTTAIPAPAKGEMSLNRRQAITLLVRLICQPRNGKYPEDAGYGMDCRPENRYPMDVARLIDEAVTGDVPVADLIERACALADLGHVVRPDVTVEWVVQPGGLTAEVTWAGYWTVGRTVRLCLLLGGRCCRETGSSVSWDSGTGRPSEFIASLLPRSTDDIMLHAAHYRAVGVLCGNPDHEARAAETAFIEADSINWGLPEGLRRRMVAEFRKVLVQ